MNKIFLKILFVIMAGLSFYACSKKPTESTEETLRISTNAAALNETPGPTAEFDLIVESAMPQSGVKIAFVVRGESDNIVYYTGPAFETSTKVSKISIFNLPQQV